MSLQELMRVEVTSVSRYPQPLREVAAAVTVLTRRDIRRAGATTIPDALRLVPGVQVARITPGTWAISARGFNSRFANKLLVMIDGRPIYTPFFSGVVWHRHDMPIANIERIEVVRGPGGPIWGANAVNGVINIITRDSGATQGTGVEFTAGNHERGIGSVRHGGVLGDGTYRVTAKGRRRAGGESVSDGNIDDAWTAGLVRFRTDMPLRGGTMRVIAGARRSHLQQQVTISDPADMRFVSTQETSKVTAGHISARWQRPLDGGGSIQLFGFYDHTAMNQPIGTVAGIDRDRLEVRGRHRFSPWPSHDLVWGVRARVVRESVNSTPILRFRKRERITTRLGGFVQDTISLSDSFDVVLGSKLSYNRYTGVEIQPTVRGRWRMDRRHTLWGAVSRAVRVPSRIETDARSRFFAGTVPPRGTPFIIELRGNEQLDASTLTAFELGYRGQPVGGTRLAVSSFYNLHRDLIGTIRGGRRRTRQPPRVILPFPFRNIRDADSYGVEAEGSWQVTPDWRLTASYAFMDFEVDTPRESVEDRIEGRTARHQGTLRSRWRPMADLRADATLRVLDELPSADVSARANLDLRLAWDARPGVTVSLTGRNLLTGDTKEFTPGDITGIGTTKAPRSVFATLQARF